MPQPRGSSSNPPCRHHRCCRTRAYAVPDTNGWCPFCERLAAAAREGRALREELIDLRDKPEWYKEMVPTTLVPAVKYDADEKVTWESVDVMRELEERFPDSPPLLPPDGTPERAHAGAMMESCSALLSSGVRMSYPNASATDEEPRPQERSRRSSQSSMTRSRKAVALSWLVRSSLSSTVCTSP